MLDVNNLIHLMEMRHGKDTPINFVLEKLKKIDKEFSWLDDLSKTIKNRNPFIRFFKWNKWYKGTTDHLLYKLQEERNYYELIILNLLKHIEGPENFPLESTGILNIQETFENYKKYKAI